jgi:alpha-L-rhamnosidase
MFSNVSAWFFKSLLGIAPSDSAPAFEQIELHPHFIKELGFAKAFLNTVNGRIEAEWRFDNGRFIYTVNLPPNVTAYFKGRRLSSGENRFVIESEDCKR